MTGTIPADVTKIVERCLRKDPARRFQTMADLKVAIDDVREAVSERHTLRSTRWLWVAMTVVAVVAAYAAWRALRPAAPAEPLVASQLTSFPGVESYPSLSPDGSQIAFTWSGPKQDNEDIWVQIIGSGSPVRLTTDARNDLNPVWSPDGRWIAFLRGRLVEPLAEAAMELLLIPAIGGTERKLTDVRAVGFDPVPAYLAWTQDSSALLVTDSVGEGKPNALFTVSIGTREKRQLTRPQVPVLADTNPAVSPDGRSLVFRRRPTWSTGELYRLSLRSDATADGEPIRLLSDGFDPDYPVWTPDGKELLVSGRQGLWRLPLAPGTQPARLPFVGEDGVMPVISRPQPGKPSRLVYVRRFEDTNIWRADVQPASNSSQARLGPTLSSTRGDLHPSLSPDGRRAAFTSTRSGDWEIWVSDLDGSNASQLTSMGARATGAPHWSPDGHHIVFASEARR